MSVWTWRISISLTARAVPLTTWNTSFYPPERRTTTRPAVPFGARGEAGLGWTTTRRATKTDANTRWRALCRIHFLQPRGSLRTGGTAGTCSLHRWWWRWWWQDWRGTTLFTPFYHRTKTLLSLLHISKPVRVCWWILKKRDVEWKRWQW